MGGRVSTVLQVALILLLAPIQRHFASNTTTTVMERTEVLELGWEGSAKRLAKRKHIPKVPLVLLVSEVELDHYIDGNATHHAASDDSVTGQVMGMVSNPSNVPSGVVEHIGVNVDPAEIEVLHNPVVFPGIGGRDLLESHFSQQRPDLGAIGRGERDIEIKMRARLPAEEGIDAPATVDNNLDADCFEPVEEVDCVLLGYFSVNHPMYGRPQSIDRERGDNA